MELYAKTEKKMEEMHITSELTWIQVQFMKKAVDVVFKCRMTLKWTYAMAYYLELGNEKELFEDNQRCVSGFRLGFGLGSDRYLTIPIVIWSGRWRSCPSLSRLRLTRRRS